MVVRFERAEVDVDARTVVLDGEPQHLEPQAFDLLAFLLANRERVVPKPELLDAVWGDQFVSESALTTRVKEIRRALGDDGDRQAVVRNFRGRGYRFVADLQAAEAPMAGSPAGLVGRDLDLAAVVERLSDHRLVTLVGPGGVGKTTLARAIGDVVRRSGPVHVVSLSRVRDSADVVPALRRATSLTDTGPDEGDLFDAVGALGALVVMDNCEHVLDEACRVIEGIVVAPGTTRVLTTSRERLGLAQEQVHPLAPLDLDDARTLLLERARAATPDYAWAEDDLAAVDDLLRMLDHLPLAIEMAAARLGSLGVRELVEHLTTRVDVLRAPNRNAEPRHRTLTELIAWSENLLSLGARQLLSQLSVFAGPVDAEDIAAVVGGDPTELAFGPLADLVDHSLVVADTSRRPTTYRLLESVRAAVAGDRDPAVDAAHARYVTDVAVAAGDALRTPAEGAAAAQLDRLIEEIRLAHRWARQHDLALAAGLTASLLHYANERQWSELASWSRAALDSPPDGTDTAPFAAAAGAWSAHHGELEEAAALAERALSSTDPLVLASARDTLGNVGLYGGDVESTLRQTSALIDLGRRHDDPTAVALAVLGHVLAPLYIGRPDDARRALETGRPEGPLSPTCEAWLAYAEGEVAAAEGDSEAAIACFEDAIEVGGSVGSTFVVSMARTSSLAVQARAGDVGTALDDFAAVLGHHRRTHGMTHATTTLRNLIVLLVRAERDADAMVLLGALSAPDTKATYGEESDLLDQARAEAERRHGTDLVAQWHADGSGHDAEWALDHAIALLSARADG